MSESQIFTNALQFAAPAERAAYLDEACAGDPQLRAAVEDLLRAQESDPSFLEHPAVAVAGTQSAPADRLTTTTDSIPPEQPGVVLAGRYKLLEEIGEGGMGTVWMAQQMEPVKRTVAVKLIKRGMDTRQVLARFEAERQALALMDHPNIAKVHDAGVTQDGRPFFVMELVKGIPITRFCDEHRLTPRQRLELFVPVCHAVQHAHQKGVIHRDLKPSNVLVALYDDRPVPKVIDFGVAKAAGQQLTDRTLHTGFGAVVGTVEYMSPEQATFNQLDVDTRSDVYSLGVLLYELLTGSPPFSKKDLEQAGMLEILRVIREQEPSKPSTKLSTADGLPTLAANRGMEPAKLTRLVRGDLDWIVMKALEKDRVRRYETANSLARDLQRYLSDEVVEARPPRAGYRLRKFVRRNRGPALAASIMLLLLLVGIVGTTLGLVEARKQRDAADTAEKLASNRLTQVESEKLRADEERDVAQTVSDFLQELLGQANPDRQPGGAGPRDPDLKVRTVLDRSAKSVATRFANKPRVEAAIRQTLALAYYALANFREARLHAERAVELHTASLGPLHRDTLANKAFLALVLYDLREIARGEALLEEVLRQRTQVLGPGHFDTLQSKQWLVYAYLGKRPADPDRAEPLMRDVVEKWSEQYGPNSPAALYGKISLAWVYRLQNRFDRSEALHLELVKAYTDKFGPDDPNTLLVRSNLGLVYLAQGKLDDAEGHFQYVFEKRNAVNHPQTVVSKQNLARLYRKQRKYDRAVPLFEQVIAKYREESGGDDDLTLRMVSEMAQTHLEARQLDKARPLIARFLRGKHEQLGPESLLLASELNEIGLLLAENDQYVEAETHLRRSLTIREQKEPDAWSTFDTRSRLGAALLGQKKFAEAEQDLLKGYEGMKQRQDKILPHDRSRLVDAMERLFRLYEAWNKPDEAAKWRKELEAEKKSTDKPETPKEKK